ncbi:MAG: CBS domain-containing protein [Parabacteroides sp.]
MLVKDFITHELPVLKSFDTVEYGLSLMDDFKIRHLPLVEENRYQILVSEKDLLEMQGQQETIGSPLLPAPSVSEWVHLHEALALITRHDLSLLPVVDDQRELKGVVLRDKLVDVLAELCQADRAGSVVVLECLPQDYSLAEVAGIVEANHAHVLSLLTQTDPASGHLLLILKIDLEDASPVIRNFERADYYVRSHYMENGVIDETFRLRMEEAFYYMNM